MKNYLLDTNICVHYLKGQYRLREKINQVGLSSCFLSEITIAELLYGVANSSDEHRTKNLEKVNQLHEAFEGRILLIGECFHEYASQKASLKKAGKVVGEFDLLIGSTAIIRDLTVVTRNTRDFINLKDIKLENWIEDEPGTDDEPSVSQRTAPKP
ncbi:PIN domain-containing protein [Persicitalea jodogahamensis]|uniref:Nucleic acid-binding protein n=1 Tax=Persicitalea jodogahamensis TaxID=402147 RepID=A0A8J3D267_9BACT|nr:PIN domain-containing protein [Persicitalea jodogahamensis]GHB68257.1 nucleic acid-binding protein [Persicitalea jodogahamensis]